MRVVLDTNVFVSSFFGGPPRAIIDLWAEGELTLCLSKPVLDEYIEVLDRMGFQGSPDMARLLTLFRSGLHTLFTGRTPRLDVVQADPADNRFLECALALEAQVIVSGEKHLLDLEDYMGIGIQPPRVFLDTWNRAS